MNDDLQDRDNQIQAIKYENVALQAQRDVNPVELQKCQDNITHLRTRYIDHVRDPSKDNIPVKITLSSLYGNTQDLPMISFMTCHMISREYNGVTGMLS